MEDRIRDFLRFLSEEQGASPNTISAYGNDLTQFHGVLATQGRNGNPTDWRRVDREALVSYLSELKDRRYAPATLARKLAAIRSFLQFLQAEGTIQSNPAEKLGAPRVGKPSPRPITPQQVGKLLEQPAKHNTPTSLRDRAMLELLYTTGLRVAELVSLNVEHISMDARRPCLRCVGNGSSERIIPLRERALRALAIYVRSGRRLLAKNKRERALFLNRRGERLTRQGVWLILKRYVDSAQLGVPVSPRTLRHSCAAHMLGSGVPLRSVQELLGHASVATTRLYSDTRNARARGNHSQTRQRSLPGG